MTQDVPFNKQLEDVACHNHDNYPLSKFIYHTCVKLSLLQALQAAGLPIV